MCGNRYSAYPLFHSVYLVNIQVENDVLKIADLWWLCPVWLSCSFRVYLYFVILYHNISLPAQKCYRVILHALHIILRVCFLFNVIQWRTDNCCGSRISVRIVLHAPSHASVNFTCSCIVLIHTRKTSNYRIYCTANPIESNNVYVK